MEAITAIQVWGMMKFSKPYRRPTIFSRLFFVTLAAYWIIAICYVRHNIMMIASASPSTTSNIIIGLNIAAGLNDIWFFVQDGRVAEAIFLKNLFTICSIESLGYALNYVQYQYVIMCHLMHIVVCCVIAVVLYVCEPITCKDN